MTGVSLLISVSSAAYYNGHNDHNDGWTSLLESSQHQRPHHYHWNHHLNHLNDQRPSNNQWNDDRWTSLSNLNDDSFSSYFNEDSRATGGRHIRLTRRVDNDTNTVILGFIILENCIFAHL